MSKDVLKIVFLFSFLSVLIKSLIFSFDVASCLSMAISASLLFSYDWFSNKKENDSIKEELSQLKVKQEELLKILQNIKTSQNFQNVAAQSPSQNLSQISLKSPFPPRMA